MSPLLEVIANITHTLPNKRAHTHIHRRTLDNYISDQDLAVSFQTQACRQTSRLFLCRQIDVRLVSCYIFSIPASTAGSDPRQAAVPPMWDSTQTLQRTIVTAIQTSWRDFHARRRRSDKAGRTVCRVRGMLIREIFRLFRKIKLESNSCCLSAVFFVCVIFVERTEGDGFVRTAMLDVARFVLWCEAE